MNNKMTPCGKCGCLIEYKTKKPLLCSRCKAVKNTVRPPKKRATKQVASKWKSESAMFELLRLTMPSVDYCTNGYYSWLPSPKGQPMQLDWYSYELGLALEYDGVQHYNFSKYFHKTKKAFKYLQDCDKLKKKLCEEEGVRLVTIRYDLSLTKESLIEEIKKQAPTVYKTLIQDKTIK